MKRPGNEQKPYLSARERVAVRRAGQGSAARRRPRRGRGRLLLLAGLAGGAIALLVLALWGWAGGALRAIEQADPRRPAQARPGTAAPANAASLPAGLREPFNVLLVGVDRRPNPEEGVRSDTLILVHVEPAAGWAGMLAIPRDSMVAIRELGMRKINTAYTYGYTNAETLYAAGTAPADAGGAFAAEAVESFLGVEVDHIAQIDFDGFQRVVDTLGGVTLDIPRPILDPSYPSDDYGYERLYIPAGLQVLDGATALRYARSRHASSDFDRSARQQQVLRAILYEVRARGLLSQAALLPRLAEDLAASVSTTLPLSDLETLRGLADLAQRIDPAGILTLSINPNDVGIAAEDGSDIYWDQNDVAAQVARLLAGPQPVAETARVQVLNGAAQQGLAGRVSTRLATQGFTMNEPADAPASAERTRLIDYSGRPETLRRLAETLGIEAASVYTSPPADAPPAPYQADIVLLLGDDYRPAWAGE